MEARLDTLREKLGQVADVRAAVALLEWDQETYMPPKGGPARGQQIATLSALAHRLFTDPALGAALRDLEDRADLLEPDDAKLVEETLYDYDRAAKLPEGFVQELAGEQSKAFQAWVKARKDSAFATFEPHLAKLVELLKQKADLLGYEGSPYNALLEDFERGMTAEQLRGIFAGLAPKQSALIRRIVESGRQPDTAWLEQDWDEGRQWSFTLRVLEEMGYDLEAGRQDKAAHPFTTNFDLADVRITTRLDPRNPFLALSASMHEGGHALYEQGFQEKDRRTTLANAPSLGIHESQSRLWENLIGRSLAFWQRYGDVMRQHFPGQLDGVTPEQLYEAGNVVEPSLIRVDADECTYNLHVILRFELETALIEGDLKVADVPEAWNAKVKEYLGIDVPDDARGCLQDVHWSHGAVGYFPSYALGNLYASQLFETILEAIPDLWDQVAAGEFAPLRDWLRSHVHQHGRRKLAREIVRDATGAEPSPEPYLRYLETKFSALYGV